MQVYSLSKRCVDNFSMLFKSDEYSAAGATTCTQCPAGYTCSGGTATQCSGGEYSPAGGTLHYNFLTHYVNRSLIPKTLVPFGEGKL